MESSSVSTPWSLPGGLDGTYTPEAQGGSGEETITDWLNVLGQGPNTRASPEYPDGFKLDARRSVSVYYAIRQTTLGLLSIAFVNGHVCKLELCDSVSDAIIELEGRFAPPAFALVCLDGIHSGIVEKLAALNIRADELVEAMERPSGRMVYIPQALSGAPFALEV
ncbi:hypothetical protein B0A48_08422 [Cryoendolithus antarcticus]|uniref:Uncharacterized protein n=1 Tax=Cryoendolithus antarcticus TaxID=1507870 RepID=A0A1V8T5E6_9PEZI|nr:hypothetical protein B0A48_08422 [Cryoendolithus antarcticus]